MSELKDKQEHLAALEAFIKSAAHKGFVAARELDVENIRNAIIMVDPVDRESEIENFKLRGELRYAEQMKKTFEDARVTLKARIDVMLEAELEAREQTRI